MRLLLIDNYDSFSNNVADYLRRQGRDIELHVVKNDAWWILDDDQFSSFDAFIISPGPGNPGNPDDLGISARILAHETRPILGVCLGHQALAHAEGGSVVRAPEPVHGRVSKVTHDGTGLFAGLPPVLEAMRYHSWMVAEPLPASLRVTARTGQIVMALEHRTLPRWGVQFHPESIGTADGMRIFANFLAEVRCFLDARAVGGRQPEASLYWRDLGPAVSPVRLVEAVRQAGGDGLLLESALVLEGMSRFSYVAAPLAGMDRVISYRQAGPVVEITDPDGNTTIRHDTIFELLRSYEKRLGFPQGLPPFDFHGGAIGWLGYELKSECAGLPQRPAGHADAAFHIVHRYLVIDHLNNRTYGAVCLPGTPADEPAADFAQLEDLCRSAEGSEKPIPAASRAAPVIFDPRHDDAAYLEMIRECQHQIVEGESYELCLTNRIATREALDPWALYRTLRRTNPAPYAAFLPIAGVMVVGSSPECYLKVGADGRVSARPIKGTIRRAVDPHEDERLRRQLADSEKERAENTIIVDMIRHDLTEVSEPGSIWVPKLNVIETYQTVHQMVSTIEGRLRAELSPIDVARAAFPGGSMTGAPKVRTMEILDHLEAGPRGVYSGALGWFGFDGLADLSIVIRTAVCFDGEVSIGCGGAITILSDPEAELDEIKLKARALMRAVAETVTGDPENYRYAGGQSSAKPGHDELPFPKSNAEALAH